MKQSLNEQFRRMQKLAGIITESKINEVEEITPEKAADMVAANISKIENSPKIEDISEKIAKQLKEYTDDNFSGSELISKTKTPTDINIFKKFFPTGVASMSNAKASLQAHDNSGIKARMGRYAPIFAHVQYHEFEDQTGEKYRAHQTQYYNSNFDKQDPNFNPSVTKLSLIKLASPNGPSEDTNMGSILVKTKDYIKDLDKLNISKRAM
jgi:ectoine hydroxylase-related dioxygenase (phytanoyl-CoA dioxygenase family)